jgi:hypothetical protein
MSDLGPRHSEDESVQCKGCSQIHSFKGLRVNVACKYDEETETVSVFCPTKNRMYDYKYAEIKFTAEKMTLERLEPKILDLEERIQLLEQKTAELPESRGIRELKNDIMRDFAEASARDQSKRKVVNG